MARKFGRYGWNRQFKNKPLRRDRWDPFPKDHLPFVDDFSIGAYVAKKAAGGSKRSRTDAFFNDTARKGPPPKRPRTRGTATRSLFTNDNVALMGTAGALAGRAAYTGAGIAMDRLNARITAGIEEGFARHAAIQNSGAYTYDALTESAMAGRYLENIAEGAERILPLVEELLPFVL